MKIKLAFTLALYLVLTLTALVIANLPILAQDQPSTPKIPTIAWKENDPNCDLIAVDGARYRIIKRNGLFIAFEFIEANGVYVAAVYVSNRSNDRVMVDPESSFLAIWKDIKKAPYETITPTPPEKIAGKIASRARWANAFRTLGAGMATTQTTTTSSANGSVMATGSGGSAIGTYAGSGSSTTTSPDLEARRQAEKQNAETTAQAQNQAANVMSAALKANTLFPKGDVSGEIYFQKKKFEAGFFVFKIGDAFYQFAVAPAQK
jgi:hypothetical protein